jgi:uncharacterized membrane protein
MFYNEWILEILNGLIQFTLFLMGKYNSKFKQIESRTASWNGLCSNFEGSLYIYPGLYMMDDLSPVVEILLPSSASLAYETVYVSWVKLFEIHSMF